MAEFDYDLFVIGAGSGGVRAARISASLGAKVAVAEERFMGGTCVNVGCVPKKLFVYGSHYPREFEDARGFGWEVPGPAKFNWQTLLENKNREIERLNGIYRNLLESNQVTIYDSRATVIDAHTLRVGDRKIRARNVLVATGSRALRPHFPGAEHTITSLEAFYLQELPKRAVIIGGGYIAVEFAGIFNGLGVHTTLAYRGDCILRGFDDDIRTHVAEEMQKSGIHILFETDFESIEKRDDGVLIVRTSHGEEFETDLVFSAIGREPNTEGLGLEEAGVHLDARGGITVDDHFRTNVESIFAVGDVINRYQLTPVALAEGMAVARTLFAGGEAQTVNYDHIATAVFCEPNIGTVGLTEAAARKQSDHVQIFRSTFRPMKNTLSGNESRTIMKLVVDEQTDRVLGVHMAGPDAGEIIQGLAVALKAGATKSVFDATIGIHPTAAEEFVTMRTPVTQA
ncbi:MAG: glutathione-disulfide reductase [bacterium]|nr:glutathione-disulfide reductase [bacterium]